MTTQRLWVFLRATAVCIVVAAGVAVATRAGTSTGSRAATPLWVARGMDVVGGPVIGSGKILVLSRDASKATWLQAIDPSNGHVLWRYHWSYSEITPGVIAEPVAHDDIALLLAPRAKNDGQVRLEGIRISTGRVAWRGARTAYVTDAPSNCPRSLGDAGFCLTFALPGTAGLIALAPQSGRVRAVIPNILRGISTTPGIYQAAAKVPTLVNVRMPGGIRWAKRVSELYGARRDPDFGWNIQRYGPVDVGTIGVRTGSTSRSLRGDVTVGVADTNGKRLWAISGLFQCGGAESVEAPFSCRLTGTAGFSKTTGLVVASKNATLTLQGFDPETGHLTWHQRVTNIAELLQGTAAFTDDHHLLVTVRQADRLLDLQSGQLSSARAVYWCSHENTFTILPPKGVAAHRIGSNRYTTCDANKHLTNDLASLTSKVGITIGKTFIYATPTALVAMTP